MTPRTRLATTAGVGGLLLAASTGAASAAQPVDTWTEEWDDTFTDVCDLGTQDPSDDITIESRAIGSAVFVLRQHTPTDEYYVTHDFTEAVTYTNVDTGISWTSLFWGHEKDLRVDVVDDIAYVEYGVNFHFRVYAPDGTPGGVSNNRVEVSLVYDIANDVVLSEEGTKDVGAGTTEDFCTDAVRFTT